MLVLACGATVAQNLFPEDSHDRYPAGAWEEKIGYGFLAEVTTACVVTGTVYGVAVAKHANLIDQDEWTYIPIWLVSLVTLVPAGSMLGVKYVGDRHAEDGNSLASYGGGLVGTLGALTLAYVGNEIIWSRNALAPGIALYAVAALLPAVGATVGYNFSCSSGTDLGLSHPRLLPPSVSLKLASRTDGRRVAGISVRLLTIRM
jgi:hypothetical protein